MTIIYSLPIIHSSRKFFKKAFIVCSVSRETYIFGAFHFERWRFILISFILFIFLRHFSFVVWFKNDIFRHFNFVVEHKKYFADVLNSRISDLNRRTTKSLCREILLP